MGVLGQPLNGGFFEIEGYLFCYLYLTKWTFYENIKRFLGFFKGSCVNERDGNEEGIFRW